MNSIAYGNSIFTRSKRSLYFWKKTGNKSILKRIAQLVKAIQQNPFEGIGKPEPLKYNLTGAWSRKITREHRLVYEIRNNKILIYSVERSL